MVNGLPSKDCEELEDGRCMCPVLTGLVSSAGNRYYTSNVMCMVSTVFRRFHLLLQLSHFQGIEKLEKFLISIYNTFSCFMNECKNSTETY